jgi:hypothetical protein
MHHSLLVAHCQMNEEPDKSNAQKEAHYEPDKDS